MITFNDENLYLKGTCNITLSDIQTGNVIFQSSKVSTGSISTSVSLEEVRAGLGNPIAAVMPTDSELTVDFDISEFSLLARAAQLGVETSYGAPVPRCQVLTAEDYSLSLDVSNGVPVSKLNGGDPICYIQSVGQKSCVMSDGVSYTVDSTGLIDGFTATPNTTYKVWYYTQSASAQLMPVKAFIKPRIVTMDVQMAVYSNVSGKMNQGTRVGWLYVNVPYLMLKGEASVSGDQSSHAITKVSGKAISYNPNKLSTLTSEGQVDDIAYYVYAPDDESASITALVVMEGIMMIPEGDSAQIPLRFVMGDRSLYIPDDFETGFTYTVPAQADDYISVSPSGVVTALSGGVSGYDTEIMVTYQTASGVTYACPVNIRVTEPRAAYSNIVGKGLVGYMII